jgi:LacI family transcriptional regulator
MAARVGIREVAALAAVAQGTVSHFINHPDRVSPEKRERIQRAIDQLGFVRNDAASQLRRGSSDTIAYIAPDVSNPFFATIAEGVEQRAAASGLSVFLANSNRSREREDAYLEMFQAHRVLGMLVASHDPIEDRLAHIRRRGTPTVLVGQRAMSSEQPSVSVDDLSGGYQAAKHLVEQSGKRIAFVGGPLGIQQIADRLEGAGRAVREAGDVTLEVINVDNRTIAEGRIVAAAIARRQPGNRPDAIFAANDLLALGLMQGLVVDNGIRIPEDIMLVGYDDIEFGAASIIPLTSIRSPHEGFGMAAVDLLAAEIADTDPQRQKHIVFPPELVVRASSTR